MNNDTKHCCVCEAIATETRDRANGRGHYNLCATCAARSDEKLNAFYTSSTSAFLRLNFSIEGNLGTQAYYASGGQDAALNVTMNTSAATIFNEEDLLSYMGTNQDLQAIVTGGDGVNAMYDAVDGSLSGFYVSEKYGHVWDAYTFTDDGHFTGTFHLDSPYDSGIGGYAWSVTFVSQSYGYAGEAFSDAMGTLKLTSVALDDGTPVDITFESGLRLDAVNPVPEPASAALLAIGMLSLTAGARCSACRRRSAC